MNFGFWGTHTATRDWCEPNYAHTQYIAEFWNTLSNALYILFGLNLLRLKHRFRNVHRFNEFTTLTVTIWGMIILGLSSGAFHATLKYWPQVLDRVFCAIPLLGLSSGFRELDSESALTVISIASDCVGAVLAMMVVFEAYIVYLAVHNLYRGYLMSAETTIRDIEFHAKKCIIYVTVALFVWCLDIISCDFFILRFQFIPHFHAIWHVLTALTFHEMALIQVHLFLCKICKQNARFETVALLITGVECLPKADVV